MDQTQVFFEVVTHMAEGSTIHDRTFGPYNELRHVKMALKQNRGLRWRLALDGTTYTVRKVTRTFSDQVETVEL